MSNLYRNNDGHAEALHEKLLLDVHPHREDSIIRPKTHFISSIITATSNFSVQYNFQAISVALIIMSSSQCTSTTSECKEGTQAEWVTGTATATVFVGAIAGQLVMGYVADIIGRNKAMLFTLSLASFGALASSLTSFGDPSAIYSLIIICRFFLGIGLGGVYPVSAAKAAEDGADGKTGKADVTGAAWSFFWQSPGAMTPWILAYIFTYTSLSVELKWRLLLGIGCLPGIVVVIASYYDNTDTAARKKPELVSEKISRGLHDWELRRKLIVTGGGWFLYDICYYGVNLFGGEILDAISKSDDDDISSNASIRTKATSQLIAQSTSIPACIITILLFKYVGLRNLHIWGFILIAVAFVLMAGLFSELRENNPDGLFALYCFLLFTLSGGPNVTTFVLPSQSYPKDVRTTYNGMSAAMGKLGAVFGAYIYGTVATATSYAVVMVICAVFAFIAAVVSYIWFPEECLDVPRKGTTHTESVESQSFFSDASVGST